MESLYVKPIALLVLAALGYAGATVGMKMASTALSPGALAVIAIGLAGAALAEIILMRGFTLGVLYIMIIAVESLLVLGYSFAIGEGLNTRQLLGGTFVLAGMLAIST